MPGISFLTKNVKKFLHCCNLCGKPWDEGKSYTTAKILLISPIRKIPLNRFNSFAIKSFIPSPSNNNLR